MKIGIADLKIQTLTIQNYNPAVTDDIFTAATECSRTRGHSLKLFKNIQISKYKTMFFMSCGYPMGLSNRRNCFRA